MPLTRAAKSKDPTQLASKQPTVHGLGLKRKADGRTVLGEKNLNSGVRKALVSRSKSSTSNKPSNESQIITLEKWADDDECDLFKPSEPELQDVQVYHPCLATAGSDLLIKCYENEEKMKNGEKPIGLIPCESKIMARRFSFFEAMVKDGSNWRESRNNRATCATVSAMNLINEVTIKSESSNQNKNTNTSTKNSSIKQVKSLFNPEKLCDFIKSVINRNVQMTSENCLDYLEMTVFYQDQNSNLEKGILNYIKTYMNTELALAIWQVPEADTLRDDSILFFKNNPKGLKYDFLSTIPVENLTVLLCELGKRKDRSKIINDHEFDCLIKFCVNVQTKKIPGFEKLFEVYEKRHSSQNHSTQGHSTPTHSSQNHQSTHVQTTFTKVQSILHNDAYTMDDIYDKLKECLLGLKKIASKKDLDTVWSDADFDQVSQILLMVCCCGIRTKYIVDEKSIDVVGPHNNGYILFKSIVRTRQKIEKTLIDARQDGFNHRSKYSYPYGFISVFKKYNQLQLVSVLQTFLDVNQVDNAKEHAKAKSVSKYNLDEIAPGYLFQIQQGIAVIEELPDLLKSVHHKYATFEEAKEQDLEV